MTRILTTRLPAALLKRLRERARKRGTTPSALVRELLDRELGPTEGDAPLLELTARWVGAVDCPAVPAGRDARRALLAWQRDRRD